MGVVDSLSVLLYSSPVKHPPMAAIRCRNTDGISDRNAIITAKNMADSTTAQVSMIPLDREDRGILVTRSSRKQPFLTYVA